MQRYHSVCFEYMGKLSLVNETLRPETETFDFQSETRPRPRRSLISPRPRRDRDIGKMRLETVSRLRRRYRDYIPGQYPSLFNNADEHQEAHSACSKSCQNDFHKFTFGRHGLTGSKCRKTDQPNKNPNM